jgi:hypothetical protein
MSPLTTDTPPRRAVEVLFGGGGTIAFWLHFVKHGEPYGTIDLVYAGLSMICLNVAIGHGTNTAIDACTRFIQALRGSTPAERAGGVTDAFHVTAVDSTPAAPVVHSQAKLRVVRTKAKPKKAPRRRPPPAVKED